MQEILTPQELAALADRLNMRLDWHEPDEADVTAEVQGVEFDNAGFWPDDGTIPKHIVEMHVILKQDGEPVAAVNLATLFAWATKRLR